MYASILIDLLSDNETILTELVVSVCITLSIRRPILRSWAASKLSSSVYQIKKGHDNINNQHFMALEYLIYKVHEQVI
jgi:hypothetical protein